MMTCPRSVAAVIRLDSLHGYPRADSPTTPNNVRRPYVNKYIDYIPYFRDNIPLAVSTLNGFLDFGACTCFKVRDLLDDWMAAFWHAAFRAFPPIKHQKREKQSAVFLM